MTEILNAFTNPTVWAGVILTFSLQFVLRHLPKAIKNLARGCRTRELRKIKATRYNQDAVTFQSMKAHAYFLVFMGALALFLVLFTIGPLKVLLGLPKLYLLAFFSPVLIAEILWVDQNSYAQELIKYRGRLRITRRSS